MYQIVVDDSLPRKHTLIGQEDKMGEVFISLNKIIKECEVNHKHFTQQNMYIEKVLIFERQTLKIAIMVIFRLQIFLLDLDTYYQLMPPISMENELDQIKKCQMTSVQEF